MRDQIVGFLESGVLVAFLVIAGWLGVEAAKASRRPWVGWCVGLSLAIAFTAFVLWLEIGPPRSGDESADDDDHYRR